jgi:hypothetical protein
MPAVLTAPRPTAAGRVWPDDYPPVHVRGIALLPRPQDVGLARRFAAAYCDSRGIAEAVAYDISVCVSELVGNWRHAIFPPGRRYGFVQLRQLGPFVSLRVFDPDPVLPVLRPVGTVDLDGECGRGLSSIVSALACRLEFSASAHGLKRIEAWVDCLPSKSF